MTRINCVPPQELHDRHLVAEYHELPRIFALVKKAIAKGHKAENYLEAYPEYVMGTGHVKFFYARLKYAAERQIDLIAEMVARKMRPKYDHFSMLTFGIPPEWFNDWEPDERALELNRARLADRLEEMKRKPKRKVITVYNEKEFENEK